ncbi:FadR/GntR family transcriptional regulator [Paraburkholderia sp. C35]|uniref:FadR/GntR family transcriptional regulator n=1 Tax=Paraburkholderia sp. C35 TaxID=2126993 RepID=UPI000D6897A0|nr:FadR/GntR family transcriptional regulator [Paraburkholderia sp. C35]
MKELNVQRVERRPHLAEHITRSLSEEIQSGRLRPGDRLPTEQFLSQNFGVSRNVVREAIASLRTQGLIETRQGIGAFVASTHEAVEPLPNMNTTLLEGDDTIRNMFEVRAVLESQAAALAATRMTARRLQPIEEAIERMRFKDKPSAVTVNADLEFHRAIASAAGNDYLEAMIRLVLEPLRTLIAANFARQGPLFGNIPNAARGEHETLLQALKDKDPVAARAVMGQHIVAAASRFGYDISFF